MQLVRTTIRLEKQLKKEAEDLAHERATTFQKLMNDAVRHYLLEKDRGKAEQIVFHSVDLGVPLDNLTRDDIYGDPEIPC